MAAVGTPREQLRERRRQTRGRIVDAAVELLRERPFREVTVGQVMRRAELTRTIFYRHFDDLPDLVMQVAGTAFGELHEFHKQLLAAAPDGATAIGTALEPAVRTFAEHGPLIRAIVDAASHDEHIERIHRQAFDEFASLTQRFLETQHDRPVADAAETARALTTLNEAYLLEAFGGRPRVSPDVALRTLAEIWTLTIGRRP